MNDILDIEGIRYFPWVDVFKLAGAFLGILILAALLYGLYKLIRYLLKRYKDSKLTPAQRALKALQILAARDWPEKGDMRLYYFELSSILRGFVQNVFAYPATEKTSNEMERELPVVVGASQSAFILEIMKRADLAKFADGSPQVLQAREDLKQVETFVRESPERPGAA